MEDIGAEQPASTFPTENSTSVKQNPSPSSTTSVSPPKPTQTATSATPTTNLTQPAEPMEVCTPATSGTNSQYEPVSFEELAGDPYQDSDSEYESESERRRKRKIPYAKRMKQEMEERTTRGRRGASSQSDLENVAIPEG
jgi:hypothetical protein